jgi:hypothetical protein
MAQLLGIAASIAAPLVIGAGVDTVKRTIENGKKPIASTDHSGMYFFLSYHINGCRHNERCSSPC